MTSAIKLRPEVQAYLENSLCRFEFKEQFGSEECALRFSQLLRRLGEPPMVTTLRMNLLKATPDLIQQKLKAVLTEQYEARQKLPPEIQFHPQISDCLVINNEGPNVISQVENEVIVDAACGAAVLRGSDIYICGILAAPPGMNPGDKVSVYADLDGQCRSGLTKAFVGPKLFLGNGRACVSRQDVFSGDKKSRGVGIQMLEPLFLAPSLSDVLFELVFPQNLPSIVCVHVLDPQPGEIILDMCAAPGGKTTHIATLMKNKGHVIALDKSRNKIAKIQENANRWELNCIDVYCFDGTKAVSKEAERLPVAGPPPYSAGVFDRVLLDAPCSGLGRRPTLTNRTSLSELKSYAPLQRKLFEKAVKLLKENGTLVYSTCTIMLEENEDLVTWALDTFPQLQLVSQTPHLGGNGISGMRLDDTQASLLQRFGPSLLHCEPPEDIRKDSIGFFIAKFVKMPALTEGSQLMSSTSMVLGI